MPPCPSLCLEAIFKHVPLVDLLRSVGLVCSTWYMSRRTELMRRRSLGIIESKVYEEETLDIYRLNECYETDLIRHIRRDDGSHWLTLESHDQIEFNSLAVPGGIQIIPFFSSLTTNFTKITRLYFNLICTSSVLSQIIRLIEHFSENLVELKLMDGLYHESDFEDVTRELDMDNLFDCINRLPSLRHLKLYLYILCSRPPLLSCLSRLETFAICVFVKRSIDWIFDSIEQYGQNVASIEIYNTMSVRTMLQLDPQLATKFKVLSVRDNSFDDEDFDDEEEEIDDILDMSLFCSRFISLTKLKIDPIVALYPMTMLARRLSWLTQLVNLNLQFSLIPPLEDGEQNEIETAQQQITQVPSVRLLTICFTTKSHRDSERLFISEIFSNLQVLRLEHCVAKCEDCEIPRIADNSHYENENILERTRLITECKYLTRQPFRLCTNLHTIALVNSGKKSLINLDEM